ncbi:MAG: hypothetical protein NVSMB26_05040 [Beijerinckiaceae bacterium]
MIADLIIGALLLAAGLFATTAYLAFRILGTAQITMPDGRRARLYRRGDGSRPTLVLLHSYSGDATTTAANSGFLQCAIPRGITVVVPEAIGGEWHDSPDAGGDTDDVAFLASLAERLAVDGIADPRRIYLAGISNGGMMAFAMICARPDLFAGIGTISASMPMHLCDKYHPIKSVPLTMIAGDADEVLPYKGGDVGERGSFFRSTAGVEATAAMFARANGSVRSPTRTKTSDGALLIERIDWSDANVTVIKVIGGGHDVPGWRTPLQSFFGLKPRGLATAATIVDQFASDAP